jgi:putative membrane protein
MGLNQTEVIRQAKNTMKDVIDDEWDSHTGEENNLFNMDGNAPAHSFTSGKNSAPQTLQVLMRTEEITVDEEDDTITVDEEFRAEGNFFTRVGSVFQAISDAVVGLFS